MPPQTEESSKSSGFLDCFSCCVDEVEDEDAEVIVHMNDPSANLPYHYPDNFIRTSKYSVLTFIPLGLLYQFNKISNVYFLINMIVCFIPGIAPVSPLTAVLPLVFVLGVALIKEGVEDYRRHTADDKANSSPVQVLRDGKLVAVESRHLCAGDVVKIEDNDEVRADLLLLSTNNEEGQVFIDTCNLDGETSLKKRRAIEETHSLNSPEAFSGATLVVHTGQPEPGLLSWTGMIEYDGAEYALSLDQFLYRGCCLKNTSYAWAMVIYAGVDTKLFRNLKERPPKSSSLDRKLNYVILGIGGIMFLMLITLSSLAVTWNNGKSSHWYIKWYIDEHGSGATWIFRFLSYFTLLSYFIPISLFVTIELCKFVQSKWMNVDGEMMKYSNGTWMTCCANTSNLNEQLCLLSFIFSDKTGTLTENIMEFKEGDILGQPFSLANIDEVKKLLEPSHPSFKAALEYFIALALCNTVDPFEKDGNIEYEGSSPDEVALVQAAALAGVKLMKRTTKLITVQLPDETEREYKVLATLEFTPERKMMSIILQDASGEVKLFNKGADSFVTLHLDQGTETAQQMADASVRLTELSATGLRTLLLTQRPLTMTEFESWHERFIAAGKSLNNREAKVDEVCLEIETNLLLVGCTAIEDRLQDQVPETLSFFLSAGVIVWMLTGDKRETAVTIAATSSIVDPRNDYIDHVDIGSLSPDDPAAFEKVKNDLNIIKQHVEPGHEEKRNCTLVIDGPALTIAMNQYFDDFLDVSQKVHSAVCCRLTPIQKANVVHMFQKHTGKTALAIGDGANDVSMIQEGRIGIGIRGLEGSQAALSADYAIPSFKHLRRLCAVHGRYALYRNSCCVMTSLYKNFTLSFIQLFFPFYCGFSAQTYFDGWLLACFNVLLTSIPPFFMGFMEKDLPEQVLMESPLLFAQCAKGLYFNILVMLQWTLEALVHAVLIFFLSYSIVRDRDHSDHSFTGVMTTTLAFCGLMTMVLIRYCITIRYWQWIEILGIALSILITVLVLVIYSAVPFMTGDVAFYHCLFILVSDAKFWFFLIFLGSFVLVVDLSVLFFQASIFPTIIDRARRKHALKNWELSGSAPAAAPS